LLFLGKRIKTGKVGSRRKRDKEEKIFYEKEKIGLNQRGALMKACLYDRVKKE
jgi:hypothetical protein